GSYPGAITLAGGLDNNYSFSFVAGNFTVTKAAITVVNTNRSKVYGDVLSNTDFTGSITGVVAGDNITLTRSSTGQGATAVAGSTYPIVATLSDPGNRLSNYTVSNDNGALTVTKAQLTITANSFNIFCGQTLPVYTGTYSGQKNSETFTVTYSSSATAGSGAGSYTIVPMVTGLTLDNYSVIPINGTLVINGVTIDANASSIPQSITSQITLKAIVSAASAGIPVQFYVDGIAKGPVVYTIPTGEVTLPIGMLPTNVYEIKAIAGSGCAESVVVFLPIYDPNGGFVTGGGWINSPAGSYVANPSLTGKANFGFVAKYKKGSTVPEGNTEFQFHAGNMNFNSSAYDDMRLVIAGSKANYKGTGTINGSGNYGFLVSAIDGEINGSGNIDKFRIKIWNKSNNQVVYDNNLGKDENDLPTTLLGGGSIVIHEVKGGKQSSTTPLANNSHDGLDMKLVEPVLEQKIKLGAYPNPFGKLATIAFTLPTDEQLVTLDVYDLKGSRVKRMYEGKAAAQQTLEFEFNGSNLSPGMYLLRLTTPKKVENFKMIMTE
ncbi:T9SS type A sorting domain-containing protein, partial [Flavihumibacter sp. R14]|nr:T9SS type A sorting domain-containing protein [Flavihumibacter soli]